MKSKKRTFGWLEVVIIFASISYSVLAPIIISFDGYLYLASAKSMFTSEFHSHYWLEKEPLFPLALKIGTIFGLKSFVIFQGIISGLSICISLFTIRKYLTQNVIIQGVAGITLLLVSHGWSITILQQTFFIFFTSLNILIVCYIASLKKCTKGTYFLVAGISLLNASFSIVIFAAFACSMVLRLVIQFKSDLQKFVSISAIIVSVYIVFLVGWSTVIGDTKEGRVFQPPYKSILTQYFSTDDPMVQWEQRLQATTGLLSIGKENFGVPGMNLPISFEARAYGLTQINDEIKCGKRDPGFDPIVDYVAEFTDPDDCTDSRFAAVVNRIHFWSFPLLPILGFAFLGLGIVGLVRPQPPVFYSLVLFPVMIWLQYVVVGGGSSRYGIPCIYSAVYLLANLAKEWTDSINATKK